MAYSDKLVSLSPDHLHTFNNALTDTGAVGTHVWTNGGTAFSTVLTSRDSTHSLTTNGTGDTLTGTSLLTVGGNPSKQVSFWYKCSAIQGPPTLIYSEGGATAGAALLLWAGNNVMLQVWDNAGAILKQIYCDKPLSVNRNYHLSFKYEDSTLGDFVEFLIDGVVQSSSNNNVGIGQAITAYSGVPFMGKMTAGTIPVGDGQVLLVAPVSGYVSNWCSWTNPPSESDFYNTVFGAGAIPEYTITSGTESNMQAQIDALTATVCGDFPLSILVEEVAGGGDLNLSANNITFSASSSSHVRYDGAGTLYWTNAGGSDASIKTGNVSFLNPYTLTLTNVKTDTEIRVFEAGTTNEVAGQETVTTGTFSAVISVPLVDVRIVSLNYKITSFKSLSINKNVSIKLEQFYDNNYRND